MIYFARRPDSGIIKIGWTDKPADRLSTLRTQHHLGLVFVGVHDGGRREEQDLHARFDHLRIEGEWFNPGPDLLRYIARKAAVWIKQDSGRGGHGAVLNRDGEKPVVHAWTTHQTSRDYPSYPWRYHVTYQGKRYDFVGVQNYCPTRQSALVRGRWRAHWLMNGEYDRIYRPVMEPSPYPQPVRPEDSPR